MPIRVFSSRMPLVLALVTIVVSFIWYLPKMEMPASPFDEAMLLVYPELCLQGKVVHRDFQTFYGPGNVWWLAGFYQVFGISVFVERMIGLLERAALSLLLVLLTHRLAPKAVGTVLVASLLVAAPLGLVAFAWMPAVVFALGGFFIAGSSIDNSEKHRWSSFWAGLFLALSLLFRPDLGPAVLLGSAVLWWVWNKGNRLRWLVGFALGLLPMLWHVVQASPIAVWNNLIYFPLHSVRDGRNIEWAKVDPSVQRLLILFLILAAANILTALWVCRRDGFGKKSVLYLCISLFGAGLGQQIFQRCDLAHLAMGALITYPLAAITVQIWLRPLVNRWPFLLQSLIGALVCGLVFYGFAPAFFRDFVLPQLKLAGSSQEESPDIWITNHGRSYPIFPPGAQFHAGRVVAYVQEQSVAGETLFVGPGNLRTTLYNDVYLYHLLMPRLSPSGYYIELNPGLTNADDSGLDLQVARADWVILNTVYDHTPESRRVFTYHSERPGKVLATQFAEVYSSGPFHVYRHHR